MNEKNRDKFVDDLLDASLARYKSVTPRTGLEGRILANVMAAHDRRSWFVWPGWLASGAVAAAIILGVFALPHSHTPPSPPVPVAKHEGLQMGLRTARSGAVPSEQRPRAPRPRPRLLAHQTVPTPVITGPREPIFPSTAPMTEQEKLLQQYVRATPAPLLSALAADGGEIPKVEIKALEITPLMGEVDEGTGSKTN